LHKSLNVVRIFVHFALQNLKQKATGKSLFELVVFFYILSV
jgi:hypothetical protein